jgi:chromosome segregation ATPase
MSERTALEVAAILEDSMPICGRAAVIALRRQHAEIERLTALNSALTAKANALVIANARLDEKIDSLTAERDTAIAAAVAAEREEHAAEIDRLRAQVKRLRDALVGVVADDDVNSLRFTAAVLESMDCDDATGSLAAVRALIDIRPEGSAGEEKP